MQINTLILRWEDIGYSVLSLSQKVILKKRLSKTSSSTQDKGIRGLSVNKRNNHGIIVSDDLDHWAI